jgi:hypothetical protein
MGDKNRIKAIKKYDVKIVTPLFTNEIYTVLDCPTPAFDASNSIGYPAPAFQVNPK